MGDAIYTGNKINFQHIRMSTRR